MKFTPEHYGEFQQAYENESDRSVAILAAAYLEDCLEEYILLRLVDAPAVRKLFNGFAPLSSFAAKIDIAFAVGLTSRQLREDLHRIRNIRNLFAHELASLTFDAMRIKAMCAEFYWPRPDGTRGKAETARAQYLMATFLCLLHVYAERDRTDRIQESQLRLPFEASSADLFEAYVKSKVG